MSNRPDPTQQERFLALLLPVRHRLVHFARILTQDHDEAKDLVSDTILAALERFETLKNEKAFLSYLMTIATRIHKRRQWRQRLFTPLKGEATDVRQDGHEVFEASIDAKVLYKAMGELPEKQREAIALFEITGLSLEEVREIQGGSLSAVKMRLVRGREKLKEILTDTKNEAQSLQRKSA